MCLGRLQPNWFCFTLCRACCATLCQRLFVIGACLPGCRQLYAQEHHHLMYPPLPHPHPSPLKLYLPACTTAPWRVPPIAASDLHGHTLSLLCSHCVPTVLLLLLSLPLLPQVLTYHVVPSAAVLSTQLTNGQVIPTALADATVTVTIADGKVKINDANVVTADIKAGGSVIHVIDAVLLPADLVKA